MTDIAACPQFSHAKVGASDRRERSLENELTRLLGAKADMRRFCEDRPLLTVSRHRGTFKLGFSNCLADPHGIWEAALEISSEQLARFREDGFVSVDRLLDERGLEAARNAFDALFRGEFERGILPDEVNWTEEVGRIRR